MCKCSIDSNVFYEYVKEVLLTSIPNNSVVVMDNATFHKRKDIQELLIENNHEILYLPPYSPHLNPIENKWAQIKAYRRKYSLNVENSVLHFIMD